MPTYKVKSPDGRTVTLRGETPPSESELDDIFSSIPTPAKPKIEGPNIIGRGKAFSLGGLPGLVISEKRPEDLLPMAGQTVGDLGGYPGTVAGATVGETARQAVRAGRGEGFNLGQVGKTAGATAAMEGVFRGLPRVLFPKQFGGKAREEAGKALGLVRKQVEQKAPFLRMAKNDIIDNIDNALKEAPFESGPQRQALVRIKNRLSGMSQPLKFDEAVQLEQQMGREAQFASEATQGRFARGPKAPKANAALKAERSRVSGKVDEMAANAGFPEHESLSAKYANLAGKYPEKDLQKMYDPTGMLIRGAIGGSGLAAPFLFNPVIGASVGLPLAWANIPPKIKTAIFRNIIDTPIGRNAGRSLAIGASEMLRRASQSSS